MGVPKKSGKGKSSKGVVPQRTAEDYFEEAEIAFMSDDLDGARSGYVKALEMEPENIEYLDAYGSFLAECGSRDEAISVLRRACDVQPDSGFEKYMYLGQVLDQDNQSEEAQTALRKGITLIRQELTHAEQQQQHNGGNGAKNNNNDDDDSEDDDDDEGYPPPDVLKEALSSALCSLAELLLGVASDINSNQQTTAAAEDPEQASAALEECEQLLNEARELYPTSPEPLQALCSMRRLQDREEEALVLLKQSMELWFKPHNPETKLTTLKEEPPQEDDEEDAAALVEMDLEGNELPSYEFRFETAKLLLELDETTETAVQVLEGLLEENDAVPHVWLLLAVAYRAGGDLEEAVEAVDEGLQVVNAMRLPADDEMAMALNVLKSELESATTVAGGGGGKGGDGDE